MRPFEDPDVAEVFDGFPVQMREGLLRLRERIFELAAETPGVGRLEETLKWGQPSYLTPESGSGSTLRLGIARDEVHFGLYAHCQTDIIARLRSAHPDALRYDGERGVLFAPGDELPLDLLDPCVVYGLTYHQ